MTDSPLYSRKVGRTVLYVRPVSTSTLAMGRARSTGMDTGYAVSAMANKSRLSVPLGTFRTLGEATDYVNAYRPAYGLLK